MQLQTGKVLKMEAQEKQLKKRPKHSRENIRITFQMAWPIFSVPATFFIDLI